MNLISGKKSIYLIDIEKKLREKEREREMRVREKQQQ
jgi:hypothetical protein